MSWNYSVLLSDPGNAGGSADATLVYDIQQALNVWSQYILGIGTVVVALDIQNTTEGRESGGPTSSAFIGTNGGRNIYESSAEYELTTGQHVNGTTSDITISIDPGYFQYLDLASGLTYASQVPSNEYNPIVVFLHELLHGFGMTGYYNQSGALPGGGYESNFDELISNSGSSASFTGANAEAAYGGAVPLTSNSTSGENYYHFGNQQSDRSRTSSSVQDPLTLDLMNGIVFFYDYQYQISNLDLAVLKDLGYSIRTVPVVNAHDVTATRNESFNAASLFSVSIASGDIITAYQFWDSAGNATGGHWIVNNSAQPVGQAIDVTPAQLSSATFASGVGPDHLWIRASDGVLWSDWKDFYVDAPVDNAPVVTPTSSNIGATHGQSMAMGSLFTVSDADHDTITAYQFWDSTPDPTSGYWVVGGAPQPAGRAINVTPAQFSTATFQSGSGSDDLWARASDGVAWGAWQEFHVGAPVDSAPVVSAVSFHTGAAHGASFTAGSLVSVSDAEHDPITAYQFWDSTSDSASGYWVVDGAQQPAGQAINVTPTQFSSAIFQSGSGSDHLWVRANDGIMWGAWQEFFVDAPVDSAPVVSGSAASLTLNSSIAAASLFTVTDADHDTIKQYELWDSTNAASNGHFVIGSSVQPAGQGIFLDASQFNQTNFVASATPATDRLWERASDGSLWSDWVAVNVTSHT